MMHHSWGCFHDSREVFDEALGSTGDAVVWMWREENKNDEQGFLYFTVRLP